MIGNPPFGKMSKAAVDFFNKAAEFADTIAFILPRSFRKETVQRRLNENFWLVKDIDLYKKDYFVFEEESWHTSCVFQIWVRSTEKRDVKPRKTIKPIGFSYVKRDAANLVVRRVGGVAGRAFADRIKDRAIEGNYFLKVDEPKNIAITINNHRFSPDVYDTVGPASLTKGELTSFINSIKTTT